MEPGETALTEAQKDPADRTVVGDPLPLNMSSTVMELMEGPELVEVVRPIESDRPDLLRSELRWRLHGVPVP